MPFSLSRLRQILTFVATMVGLIAELLTTLRGRPDAAPDAGSERDEPARRSCEESTDAPE